MTLFVIKWNPIFVCFVLLSLSWQAAESQSDGADDAELLASAFKITTSHYFESRSLQANSKNGHCVSFYAQVTEKPATLGVSAFSKETMSNIRYVRKIDSFNEELQPRAELTLHFFDIPKQKENFTIQMNLKNGEGKAKEAMLYDVEISKGKCGISEGACDFSNYKYCGFESSPEYIEINRWKVKQAKHATKDDKYFPKVDHTTGTSKGYYMGVSVNGKLPTAELISREITSNISCVVFYWAINGAATLQVGRAKSVTSVQEYRNEGKDASKIKPQSALSWYWGSAEIISEEPFKLQFRAQAPDGAQSKDNTYLAIDDVQVLSRSCYAASEDEHVPTLAPITQKGTCDFETKCVSEWMSTNQDQTWGWKVTTAKDNIGTAPRFDHTKGSQDGHFAFVSVPENATLGQLEGERSNLIGQAYDRSHNNDGHNCFSFWYFMDGPTVPRLSAYFGYSDSNLERLWTREGNQGPAWKQAFVHTPYRDNKLGHIEFEVTATQPGKVAIDDVVVYDGPCPVKDHLCDLETKDLCGYDLGGWEWNKGEIHGPVAGIDFDHTTGTTTGYYVVADTSRKEVKENPEFVSPRNYPTSGRCLKFFYYAQGSSAKDEEALKVLVELASGDQYIIGIYSGSKDDKETWQQAEINIVSYDYFQIIFHASKGVVSLDDIQLSEYSCQHSYGCDFEDGFCSWRNGLHNKTQLDWQIISGGHLPAGETGPTKDVTLNKEYGQFLLLSTSAPAEIGDMAVLVSQEMVYGSCLTFYYSMIGSHTGFLIVNITNSRDNEDPVTLWYRHGNQGQPPVWRYAKVDLVDSTTKVNRIKDYQIHIIGTVGYQLGSDIAIDEIDIHSVPCADVIDEDEFMVNCQNTSEQIKRSQVCNFIPDCPDGSDEENCGDCDFSEGRGYCQYVDVSRGEVVWASSKTADSYELQSIPARPTEDHKNKTGNFMLVNLDAFQEPGEMIADLETHFTFGPSPEACQVQFYYYTSAGITYNPLLKVVLRQSSLETTIFETSVITMAWKTKTIDIGSIDSPFKLAFLGSKNFAFPGSVAIDDIKLINCEFPPEKKECGEDEFMCERHACVPMSSVCDFADNCGDQSDEENCDDYILRTSFEEGLGKLSKSNGDTQWRVEQGKHAGAKSGMKYAPGRDHTLGMLDGHYILLYKDPNPNLVGTEARIISPVIRSRDSSACHLRFFYYIDGYVTMNTLNVYVRTSILGTERKIFSRYTSHEQTWTKADIEIDILNQDFQFIFEGLHDTSSSSIALDDISMSDCQLSDSKTLPDGEPTKAETSCEAGQFRCDDGQCISAKKVKYCDFKSDCQDGSDEKYCGICDFETGDMCGWTDESRGLFSWVQRGVYQQGLPETDATGNSQGHFLLLKTNSPGSEKSAAFLVSPVIDNTDPNCELTLFYYTNAAGEVIVDQFLTVGLQGNYVDYTDEVKLMPKIGDGYVKKGAWTKLTYALTAPRGSYKIIIRRHYQDFEGANPTIAIDDIRFQNCAQPSIEVDLTESLAPLECAFRNNSFCNYHPMTIYESDLEWSHSYVVDQYGQQSSTAVAMAFGSMQPSQYAVLTSNWITPPKTDVCLGFWFLTFGTTLEVRATGLTGARRILFSHFSYEYMWNYETVNIPAYNDTYRIEFFAKIGDHSELLYLSDVTAKLEKCPAKALCDFEQDLCGYTSKGETKWVRSNINYNDNDKPDYDHSDKDYSGHYIYVQESEKFTGDISLLVSPLMTQDPKDDSCTYFWYFLKNSSQHQAGTLFVTTKSTKEHFRELSLWKSEGIDTENIWHQGRINIPKSIGQYTLEFEAVPVNGHFGVIILDDIENVPGGTCPTPGSCDFDSDMCGYVSINTDDTSSSEEATPSRWLRLVNDHPLSVYGPKKEHTGNFVNGGYAFSDQFIRKFEEFGSKSVMVSPFIRAQTKACVSFWYFFDGPAAGSLTVTVADQYVFEVMSKSGQWRQGFLDHSSTVPYRIVFESTRDTTAPGSLAVDDIVVSHTACSKALPTTPKPKRETTTTKPVLIPDAPVPGNGGAADNPLKTNCDKYCKYWTSCHANQDGTIQCLCREGYTGSRCNQPKEAKKTHLVVPIVNQSTDQDTAKQTDTSSSIRLSMSASGIIAGIICVILGLTVLAIILFVYMARTRKIRTPSVLERTLPVVFPPESSAGIDNPNYNIRPAQEHSNPVFDPDTDIDFEAELN